MKQWLIIFWFLSFLPVVLQAQKPQFSNDQLLTGKEMSQVLQDRGSPQLGLDFEQLWTGKFTVEQKKKLTDAFVSMVQKGYKVDPYFQKMVAIINKAAGHDELSAAVFNNFITTLTKSVELSNPKELSAFMKMTDLVLEKRSFFSSSYNSLQIEGGTLDFEYAEPAQVEIMEEPVAQSDEEQPAEEENDWFDDWDSDEEEWDTDWEEDSEINTEEATALILSEEEPQMPIQGPVVRITMGNLVFVTRNDSVSLKGASGSYYASIKHICRPRWPLRLGLGKPRPQ